MRWRMGRRSDNIEDRRGAGGFGGGLGGGLQFPRSGRVGGGRAGGIGIVGLIVIVGLALLFGVDPGLLLQGPMPGQDVEVAGDGQVDVDNDERVAFVSVVLADTEDTWNDIFDRSGEDYGEPTLVLFRGAAQSACGYAQSAVGPFYCPGDRRLYMDLDFLDELQRRLGAPGDFAQAYVIAHEVGHHVQNELGIMGEVHGAQSGMSEEEWNAVSVRLELQADCLAGVWAHHADRARQILEAGDIEEALNAAEAVGDDRLQRRSQGTVVPESFTHGTSAQRARWFRRGLDGGDVQGCDTFAVAQP